MGYAIKILSLLLVVGFQIWANAVYPLGIMGLVFLGAVWVFREKYHNYLFLFAVEGATIFALSFIHPCSLFLGGVLAFDLAARGEVWLVPLLLPLASLALKGQELVFYCLLLALCGLCGYLRRVIENKELNFNEIYDRERRSRYALEEAKIRLTNSTREVARLTEIRERNRIAREIHDSLGHNLAGILLQLQVVAKTMTIDGNRAREMLDLSIQGLADSVNLLRDTVYNIRPQEQLGLDYFKKLIEDYRFCAVNFQPTGDLSRLSPHLVEILAAIVKEAMTNAARHSRATEMEILLEVRTKIVRLYIRDDGVGCDKLVEGMGIIGMRERVRNAGGTITINPRDGFMIVCILPREEALGGELTASANS